jgi:hypothetical protein
MTAAVVAPKNFTLPGTLTTFSNWIGDKGKYACEALANVSFYLAQIPTLYGNEQSSVWSSLEGRMKDCKKILALPSAVKGSITLYENVRKGKESYRNLLGEFTYVLSDAIDGFQGFHAFGFGFLGKCSGPIIDRIKDFSGIYGLSNTSYNLTVDMNKLRQIDPSKEVHPEMEASKKEMAVDVKKNWIQAEINNKWHDRLRCMSAVAMCALGTVGALFVAIPAAPWVFAALGTAGVYGKYNMYAAKAEAGFWKSRHAELLPAAAPAA